jgi:flagellar motor switch protein FliN/FliY
MSGESLSRELFAAFVDELAVVLGAMIDSPARVEPGAPPAGKQWVAEVKVEGALEGWLRLVLDYEGSSVVTKVMTGVEGDVPVEAVVDSLREVLAQALAAVAVKPAACGAKLSLARLEEKSDLAPDGEQSAYAIGAEKLESPLAVAVSGQVALPAAAPEPSTPATAAAVSSANAVDPRIEVLLDIDLPLVVRFGQTELPLRQLTRLGPGSVIDLGRSPDDPVEVLVSNRVVARGEVVVVSGSYGIRILDVVSQRERVRSMEA